MGMLAHFDKHVFITRTNCVSRSEKNNNNKRCDYYSVQNVHSFCFNMAILQHEQTFTLTPACSVNVVFHFFFGKDSHCDALHFERPLCMPRHKQMG